MIPCRHMYMHIKIIKIGSKQCFVRHFASYLRLSHVRSTFHWKGKNIFVFYPCPLNCYRYETESLSKVSVRFLATRLLG